MTPKKNNATGKIIHGDSKLYGKIKSDPKCLLRLRNDLYCVGWGVKLYSLTTDIIHGDLKRYRWKIYSDPKNMRLTKYTVTQNTEDKIWQCDNYNLK